MGRNRRHSLPQMRLHAGSGHARVRINGTEHWLGRFGSPEAQAAYDRLIAEYLSNGRQIAPKAEPRETAPPLPPPDQEANQASPPIEVLPVPVTNELTVAEVCVLFMDHAKTYYRLSDGRLSSSYDGMLQAVNALRPFGKLPAAAFGPRYLRQIVESLVDGPDLPPLNEATSGATILGGRNQGRARDATRKAGAGGANHSEAPRGGSRAG